MQKLLVALAAVFLAASASSSAGGWGVITFEDLPDVLPVGQRITTTIAVRGHGRVLAQGLSTGRLELVKAGQTVGAPIVETSAPGRYRSEFTVPDAGDWTLTATIGYSVRFPVLAASPDTDTVHRRPADRGERLFLSKGCVTCHRHDGVDVSSVSVTLFGPQDGPNLTGRRYASEMVTAFLTAPPCVGRSWTVCMPNLGLTPDEAASLGAFLNEAPMTRSAAR
jgi:hypothetical protein